MSSRLTKKSFVSTPGLSVNTPCLLPPWFAPRARNPPISTVNSGAVVSRRYAFSNSNFSSGNFSPGRLVAPPALRGRGPRPPAVGAAALVGAAEARRCRPGGLDQLRNRQTGVEHLGLQRRDVRLVDQLAVDVGHRVLPQLRLGDPRPEEAADRPHVTVQQLVPGLSERLVELFWMVEPSPRDRACGGVDPHRDV